MPLTSRHPDIRDPHAELAKLLQGHYPDAQGRFGPFGGRYVPETLFPALQRLETAAKRWLTDADFLREYQEASTPWIGRPTPLMFAPNLSQRWNARVYLKREDLAHTGAHKINNALGQVLLAKKLGVTRIIAETGAGQHGVATAAACARVGFPCTVYMGAVDVQRQQPNVQRMKWFGANVVAVTSGEATLRAAIDQALRDWVSDPMGTHYVLGSAVGPHPFPWIVRTFQSIIGREARQQMLGHTGALPDAVFSCVGGGSNAIGMFHAFLGDERVAIFGAEAGGSGPGLGQHAATIAQGSPGVLQGAYSYLLQDQHGQVQATKSISAGLDYPGIGPEHAFLHAIGRVDYTAITDAQVLDAVREMCQTEGILPAIEPSHAVALARNYALKNPGKTILINLCGRGDKDMPILMQNLVTPASGATP